MQVKNSFFQNVINMNKLLFQCMQKEPYRFPYTDRYNQLILTLNIRLNQFYADIENEYYNKLLYPNLQEIWKVEKDSYMMCIICIIYSLMQSSDHVKYSQIHA
jgi:hypothetical protein